MLARMDLPQRHLPHGESRRGAPCRGRAEFGREGPAWRYRRVESAAARGSRSAKHLHDAKRQSWSVDARPRRCCSGLSPAILGDKIGAAVTARLSECEQVARTAKAGARSRQAARLGYPCQSERRARHERAERPPCSPISRLLREKLAAGAEPPPNGLLGPSTCRRSSSTPRPPTEGKRSRQSGRSPAGAPRLKGARCPRGRFARRAVARLSSRSAGAPAGLLPRCEDPTARAGAVPRRRGCFTNQRRWCQATTAWRATETDASGELLRASAGSARLICLGADRRSWRSITNNFRSVIFVKRPPSAATATVAVVASDAARFGSGSAVVDASEADLEEGVDRVEADSSSADLSGAGGGPDHRIGRCRGWRLAACKPARCAPVMSIPFRSAARVQTICCLLLHFLSKVD